RVPGSPVLTQHHLHPCTSSPGPTHGTRTAFVFRRAGRRNVPSERSHAVLLIVAVLLLALILAGVGFAVHVLWWIALIVLAIWLLGFLFRVAEGGGSR